MTDQHLMPHATHRYYLMAHRAVSTDKHASIRQQIIDDFFFLDVIMIHIDIRGRIYRTYS